MYYYRVFFIAMSIIVIQAKCADNTSGNLHVKTLLRKLIIPFSGETYIGAIKEVITVHTQIHPTAQKLYLRHTPHDASKNARTSYTELEDMHTCEDYDLKHAAEVQLFLQ